MRPELRFLLALTLMLGVFFATNLLFPPVEPEPLPAVEEAGAEGAEPDEVAGQPVEPPGIRTADDPPAAAAPTFEADDAERLVTVETPLYRMTFSNHGAVVRSLELLQYESFAREGNVDLVPEGGGILGARWRYETGSDPVDLSSYAHSVSPSEGLRIGEGSGPRTLTFRYDHPRGFFSEIRYTFTADSYIVEVEGDLPPSDRTALFISLGTGVASNERRERDERRMINFVGNPVDDGIRSRPLLRVREPETIAGPLHWAAVKSKYFTEVILPAAGPVGGEYLTGLWAEPSGVPDRGAITVGAVVGADGGYAYRAYLGPIERDRLVAIGENLEEINPYGWAFFRPIIRPLVEPLLWLVEYMHVSLRLGYGWVLISIGVLLRLVLWPLNRRAMRSQVKTMAIQPLAQEIKEKYYKTDPQRMQQETVKLYKEHGVNPMAGCLPLLIPMPIFIALFFVFQNTIELRGVPFMWLPDLSARDPYYILPLFCGLSMYLLQRISMRVTQGAANPQMKMMMYFLPIFMTAVLWTFPSGLNLYYAAVNVAMIPQQILIANERRNLQAANPAKTPA